MSSCFLLIVSNENVVFFTYSNELKKKKPFLFVQDFDIMKKNCSLYIITNKKQLVSFLFKNLSSFRVINKYAIDKIYEIFPTMIVKEGKRKVDFLCHIYPQTTAFGIILTNSYPPNLQLKALDLFLNFKANLSKSLIKYSSKVMQYI